MIFACKTEFEFAGTLLMHDSFIVNISAGVPNVKLKLLSNYFAMTVNFDREMVNYGRWKEKR
jgi:hypothetical protein